MACNNKRHVVTNVTATDSNVALTVSNPTNISSLEEFNLVIPCRINVSSAVSGAPLPVQVIVNGTAVALLNKYSIQIMSNHVPRRAKGAYVVPASGTPYVILWTTPQCKANA